MKNAIIAFLLLVISLSLSAQTTIQDSNSKETSITNLKANLRFIASDYLEGRNAASRGEFIAGEYIISELKKNGMKPLLEEGFRQPVDLIAGRLTKNTRIVSVNKDKESTFFIDRDFAVFGTFLDAHTDTLMKNEVVFAGYGITAPEYQYDDYNNISVEGKIVVMISGEPHSTSDDFFEGGKNTKYASAFDKYFNAQNHGAKAVIVLMENLSPGIVNVSNNEYMCLKNREYDMPDIKLPILILANHSNFAPLFDESEYNLAELSNYKTTVDEIPKFTLNSKVNLKFTHSTEYKSGYNIISTIKGNDPKLNDEYVVLSAHYDHVGFLNGQVCNGADDNGTGIVSLLEIARRLNLDKNLKRSVIITFFTGEEKGLLGAQYFVNSLKNNYKLIADINVDMCGREEPNSIYCLADDHCGDEFADLLEKVNSTTVNMHLDHRLSEPTFLKKADHAPFFVSSIPCVSFYDHMNADYHRPTDDIEKIDFNKVYKTTNLAEAFMRELANRNETVEFGK